MDEFEEDDGQPIPPVSLIPTFSGEEFARRVAYPVIVEAWDHKNYGRGKRGWLTTFDENERKLISSYYAKFYKWYFVKGTPRKVTCRLKTVNLLQRAVNFFATI